MKDGRAGFDIVSYTSSSSSERETESKDGIKMTLS
jgi:hypothetical protein